MSFILKDYGYHADKQIAWFEYENNGISFKESFEFGSSIESYDGEVLDRALFLAFILMGTSYYKTFPSRDVVLKRGSIDAWQARFFTLVYQEGMSQFAFENNLTRGDLAVFSSTGSAEAAINYNAIDTKPLVLQSGGKDSLLLGGTLSVSKTDFTSWYFSTSNTHPLVIDTLRSNLATTKRHLDIEGLRQAKVQGGLDGHVPVSYIVFSVALIQAILLGKNTVLTAIGHEGEEPYAFIDDLPVAHQWAKTWQAERQFAEYVKTYVSEDIHIGSPLRQYSELKIAELFSERCWGKYGHEFSSCNLGNYKQGQSNERLSWCGNCAKCANSFLLFAPFVPPSELTSIFGGENLFKKASLIDVFKGILEIDGAPKDFECVGERDELRLAYKMAHKKSKDYTLPFEVPDSNFDYEYIYPMQSWVGQYFK